jgi:PhnB protein
MDGPDGMVLHAEIELGNSVVMVADAFPQASVRPPTELGGTTVSILTYVEDVDAVVEQAVDAGATVIMPVDDMFWGDRYGKVRDPFGHEWEIATHPEDLSPEEVQRRGEEMMANMS